ncbi:MAG: hypothetical protein WC438_03690 [Candidatus Pacearchaeota archaeon]
MKIKYLSLICISFILMLVLITNLSAVCTVTFDKDIYHNQETVTAAMSCSEATEKSKSYTLNWTNSSGYQLELDTGTTPAISDTQFFKTYVLSPTYSSVYGGIINATLIGSNLEGNDWANVTNAGASDLVITNASFTSIVLLGKRIGIKFDIKDENNKKISNAKCSVNILDSGNNPIDSSIREFYSFDGRASFTQEITKDSFNEGSEYRAEIRCTCGGNNTNEACFDEEGTVVINSKGTASGPFVTNTWLTVNTLTDKSIYHMKDEIFICVNVTNVDSNSRVPMHIYNQVRCSRDLDNNSDLDRVLIISDDEEPDERGISVNTTQMQCKRFVIPESSYLQGRNSQCYASTTVWVLDQNREKIVSYATTSPAFNITSDELNIIPDWERISEYVFNSIINLSDSNFANVNGTGIGNIDLKLHKVSSTIKSSEQYGETEIGLDSFVNTKYIKNITGYNLTGTFTPYLEILEDGSVEIELRDVDISSNGWYNITLEFNSFEERQSSALEGIENKTGTFHLDVSCPSTGTIGNDMDCVITAYVEDSQLMEKEADFTCYISDGVFSYSSVNFNQMITRTPLSLTRSFSVPSSFVSGQNYILQCYADYYNLGSRRDSFYDTFIASTPAEGGGSSSEGGSDKGINDSGKAPITGGVVDEGDNETPINIIDLFNEKPYVVYFVLLIVILTIIILLIRHRKCKDSYHVSSKTNWKGIVVSILKFLLVVIIFAVIIIALVYGYPALKNNSIQLTSSSYSILQDSLFRNIILIGFIVLMIIILFKALNLRGEIRFGDSPKSYEDKQYSKMQNNINKMVLKREIEREKERIKDSYKTRKVSPGEFSRFLNKIEDKIEK